MSVALVLVPVGLLGFDERLMALRAIGVTLCLIGLWHYPGLTSLHDSDTLSPTHHRRGIP